MSILYVPHTTIMFVNIARQCEMRFIRPKNSEKRNMLLLYVTKCPIHKILVIDTVTRFQFLDMLQFRRISFQDNSQCSLPYKPICPETSRVMHFPCAETSVWTATSVRLSGQHQRCRLLLGRAAKKHVALNFVILQNISMVLSHIAYHACNDVLAVSQFLVLNF